MYALEVVNPLHPFKVTNDMRVKALNFLMYLTHKCTSTVKGRGCADGRKQKAYVNKEDAAAPTVSLQALLVLSCLQNST